MEGGNATVADLVAGTDRGVLVTRFWYIRPLDPQTLLFTGLTRDGLFLIEKGKVTRPVRPRGTLASSSPSGVQLTRDCSQMS